MDPGRTSGQHVQLPSGDVQSNTDTDPGVPGQARAHVQSASANSAPDLIEPVSQAHVDEMARLILQQIHEIGKKPLAVPEPPQAGARAPSFLKDGGSQTSIRSDHEEYRTPVRQTRRTETSVDRSSALRQAAQPPPSCSELARELGATQRRLSDLEYSLRAEIQDLRREVRARPRVALSREHVPGGTRDHRRYTSEDEIGFTSGAEEGIQRILDREVAPQKTKPRRHRRRRSTSSDSCDSDSSA